METHIDTLSILAEVTVAFVAFATIVASIKLTIGGSLTQYQRLLIHYFTESSMLSISIALMTLVLLDFFPNDKEYVALISLRYAFATCLAYLFIYLRRRLKIHAPTSFTSLIVIIAYIVMIFLLGMTVSGQFWPASIPIMSAVCLCAFMCSALVFSSFLSSFIDRDEDDRNIDEVKAEAQAAQM